MAFSYNLKRLLSFLYPIIVERFDSQYSGTLELTLHNGGLVLDTANANYSHGSLHDVFRKAIKEIDFKPQQKDALILGFGAGSIATILNKERQLGLNIDGVDVDALILDIYKQYFQFEQDQCQLHVADVFDFLQQNDKQYDYIFIDLFINLDVPDQILSKDFIALLQKASKTNTAIIMNTMLPKNHTFVQLWQATYDTRFMMKHYDAANLVLFVKK